MQLRRVHLMNRVHYTQGHVGFGELKVTVSSYVNQYNTNVCPHILLLKHLHNFE